MIALGIDPGFAFVGLGVLEFTAASSRVLHHETLKTNNKISDAHRLDLIADHLLDLIEEWQPRIIGYENQAGVEVAMQRRNEDGTPTGTNYSSRRVHEVSGIIRCAARWYGATCYCLAPATVKVALMGKGGGRAKKAAIKDRVRAIFHVECSEHAADAIAVAVGATHVWRREQLAHRVSASVIH